MSSNPAAFVPTKPGYYWFKDPSSEHPSVVCIDAQMVVWFAGSEVPYFVTDSELEGQFLGPVAPPEFTLPDYQFCITFGPTRTLHLPVIKGNPVNTSRLTTEDVTTEIARTEAHLSKLLGVPVKIEQVL